jgi:hypothetical protein
VLDPQGSLYAEEEWVEAPNNIAVILPTDEEARKRRAQTAEREAKSKTVEYENDGRK